MANTFKFMEQFVGMECLRILKNSLEVARVFNTDQNKDYKQQFAIGETTSIKLPQQWLIRDGIDMDEGSVDRRKATVTMQAPFGIDFGWDSVEQALKAERSDKEISDQYIKPAMAQLAQEIDSRAARFAYLNTNNIAGVLGTTPTTNPTYQRTRTLLKENACPWTGADRITVVSPAMMEAFVANNETKFNPPSEIAKEFRSGEVGEYAGSTWVESMSLYDHTAGTAVTSLLLSASPAQGATSLAVSGTDGQTVKQGDVIALDYGLSTQVNNVNPATRRSTGRAKTFVVTQDMTIASSAGTIQIYPAIELPGTQYQNIDSVPASNATVTLFPGTTSPSGKHGVNGLCFTRDAFALVSAPLDMPEAVEPGSFMKRDPKTGVGVRCVRAWEQRPSRISTRLDVMIGFGVLRADNCSVRILSLQ